MALYIICTVIGLFVSFILVMFSAAGGESLGVPIFFSLIVSCFIVIAFIHWQSKKGRGPQSAVFLILPPFIAPFLLILISPIYNLDDGKSKQGSQQNYSEFKEECRNAGAQYYKLPTRPVHSIAHYKNGEYPSFFEYHETENMVNLLNM